MVHAQNQGEAVAWIQPEGGDLYPPDLADAGVLLDELVIVHVPKAQLPHGLARAAELLQRSGAFGLVVLDLVHDIPKGSAWQNRLAALAREHHMQLVLLTDSDAERPSLGPMVGVRIEATRERRSPGHFALDHQLLKNKAANGWLPLSEARRGPAGLG